MKIAVLSGKGGTGKTFISTNLAWVLSENKKVKLVDVDVEEPNSRLFFNIKINREEKVNLLLPRVDQEKCTHCGKCSDTCEFSAISAFPTATMVFKNLCHGCGACMMVCPTRAISEIPKELGRIRFGEINSNLSFAEGELKIGEPSGVKIIRELKKMVEDKNSIILFDSPPGATCPVVETLRNVDFALLVTEGTPFGLHDLKIAYEIVKEMNIPSGIIINRNSDEFKEIDKFAEENKIKIIEKIPFSRDIASEYSSGNLFVTKNEEWKKRFYDIFTSIEKVVKS